MLTRNLWRKKCKMPQICEGKLIQESDRLSTKTWGNSSEYDAVRLERTQNEYGSVSVKAEWWEGNMAGVRPCKYTWLESHPHLQWITKTSYFSHNFVRMLKSLFMTREYAYLINVSECKYGHKEQKTYLCLLGIGLWRPGGRRREWRWQTKRPWFLNPWIQPGKKWTNA